MKKLVLHPTATAQWKALLADAQNHCGQSLHEDLESYLVFLLQQFTEKPEVAGSVLAIDYLESYAAQGKLRIIKLKEVGDKCLLFSGLFPEHAERKRVNVTYFIELGQSAYTVLSELHDTKAAIAALFETLGEEFIRLMELLHCIRDMSGVQLELSPMQAEALWRTTGSKQALQNLKCFTKATPLQTNIKLSDQFH